MAVTVILVSIFCSMIFFFILYTVIQSAIDHSKMAQNISELTELLREKKHYVADNEREIIGHLLLSKADLVGTGEAREVIVLAPIAVKPEAQRQGIGKLLIAEGLNRCRGLGYPFVFLIGHPSYYPHFGFRPARPLGFELKQFEVPDEVFMVVELFDQPSATEKLSGELRYPPAFFG